MLKPFSTNHDIKGKATGFSITNSEGKERKFALTDNTLPESRTDRPQSCFVRAPFSLLFKGAECTCSSRGRVTIRPPAREDASGFETTEPRDENGNEATRLRFQAVFNSNSGLWST